MHSLLESAWMKVDRANAHFNRLKAEIEAFGDGQFDRIGVYLDRQTGEKIYRLDRPTEEAPPKLSPIIGDALFGYRSALDHLIWALVLVSGNTPDETTEFPIFWHRSRFTSSRRVQAISKSVTPEIYAAIKREQPFEGSPGGLLLWRLHNLHNVDKHRHFNLVTSFYWGALTHPRDIQIWRAISDRLMTNFGRVEQGTELARIPREYVDVDFYPTFAIAFGDETAAPGEPVEQVVGGIDDLVHNILDQYERAFFFNDPTALGSYWNSL